VSGEVPLEKAVELQWNKYWVDAKWRETVIERVAEQIKKEGLEVSEAEVNKRIAEAFEWTAQLIDSVIKEIERPEIVAVDVEPDIIPNHLYALYEKTGITKVHGGTSIKLWELIKNKILSKTLYISDIMPEYMFKRIEPVNTIQSLAFSVIGDFIKSEKDYLRKYGVQLIISEKYKAIKELIVLFCISKRTYDLILSEEHSGEYEEGENYEKEHCGYLCNIYETLCRDPESELVEVIIRYPKRYALPIFEAVRDLAKRLAEEYKK